jgi:hypothetical protein
MSDVNNNSKRAPWNAPARPGPIGNPGPLPPFEKIDFKDFQPTEIVQYREQLRVEGEMNGRKVSINVIPADPLGKETDVNVTFSNSTGSETTTRAATEPELRAMLQPLTRAMAQSLPKDRLKYAEVIRAVAAELGGFTGPLGVDAMDIR